jgi:hypothetical protein
MTDFIPREKGVPIRFPSEANLLVDSADKGTIGDTSLGSSGNFTISRAGNLLNGFFTRITPTEIALDWRVPNVSPTGDTSDASNNLISIDISGASSITSHPIILPTGQYTCADVINSWLYYIRQALPTITWTLTNIGNMNTAITADLSGAPVYWRFPDPSVNRLIGNLGFNNLNAVGSNPFLSTQVNNFGGLTNQSAQLGLSKYKFLDFVSPQLTNQQDVKDGTTNAFFSQNSLYRWYLGSTNDTPPNLDSLGFPIYPTYKQFYVRRDLANPKFIKWEANIPVGNVSFQVWATRWLPQNINDPNTWNTILDNNYFSWQMTLQASEV